MFNNTCNTHKRKREENYESSSNEVLISKQLSYGTINFPNKQPTALDAYNQKEVYNVPEELVQDYETSTYVFEDNLVKKYNLYVGDYIYKLYELKDTIEFISNVELTYEINKNIVISYIKLDDLNFTIGIINDLKKNIVLDKKKIFKAKILIEDFDIIHEYWNILDRIKDEMIAPSVSYKYVGNKIIFKGPVNQLTYYLDKYNKLVENEFHRLKLVKPKIYKRYNR